VFEFPIAFFISAGCAGRRRRERRGSDFRGILQRPEYAFSSASLAHSQKVLNGFSTTDGASGRASFEGRFAVTLE
jgi:hypothetical protein